MLTEASLLGGSWAGSGHQVGRGGRGDRGEQSAVCELRVSPVRDVAGRTHVVPVRHCVWLAARSEPSAEVGTSAWQFEARWPGGVSGPGQVQAPADRSRAPCPGGTLVGASPGAWLIGSWLSLLWHCIGYLGPPARMRLRFWLEHD